MSFDPKAFFVAFKEHLDSTREIRVQGKTANAVDTWRVFKATDHACESQPEFFPPSGKSWWRGEGGSEFLCDYTYHDQNQRVLLALESEWGSLRSPKQTITKVIFDFRKVMNMAAPVKVMVFAFTDAVNKQSNLDAMGALVSSWPQESINTLIAISCPWHDEMYGGSVSAYVWKRSAWVDIEQAAAVRGITIP